MPYTALLLFQLHGKQNEKEWKAPKVSGGSEKRQSRHMPGPRAAESMAAANCTNPDSHLPVETLRPGDILKAH
eukprot:1159563-Pelagomonas_calceolata.AAC.2